MGRWGGGGEEVGRKRRGAGKRRGGGFGYNRPARRSPLSTIGGSLCIRTANSLHHFFGILGFFKFPGSQCRRRRVGSIVRLGSPTASDRVDDFYDS